jgi:hypothetical protein
LRRTFGFGRLVPHERLKLFEAHFAVLVGVDCVEERLGRAQARRSNRFGRLAETLEEGRRIYLIGCGATGRLSLSLEHLWRRRNPSSDQVRSLMAGGDVHLLD